MSEQYESLTDQLELLGQQPPPAPFATAELVRQRGRRRQRRLVSVSMAALVVVGLTAGGAVATLGLGSGPSGPPAAAPAPSPQVNEDWFLAPAQLGPGDWRPGWEPERFEGDPPWLWGELCPSYRAGDYRSLVIRQELRARAWTDGGVPGERGDDPVRWVDQVVELFPAGGAELNLADIETAVAGCGESAGWPPEVINRPSYEVVAIGFAGDAALLIEEAVAGEANLTAVVRVGEAVVSLRAHDPTMGRADRDWLLALAADAADRLP